MLENDRIAGLNTAVTGSREGPAIQLSITIIYRSACNTIQISVVSSGGGGSCHVSIRGTCQPDISDSSEHRQAQNNDDRDIRLCSVQEDTIHALLAADRSDYQHTLSAYSGLVIPLGTAHLYSYYQVGPQFVLSLECHRQTTIEEKVLNLYCQTQRLSLPIPVISQKNPTHH